MNMDPEIIEKVYGAYDSAKNMWKNIDSEGINEKLELMYDLYKVLQGNPIISSNSSYEEKKSETLDRFSYLGSFMSDTKSIELLTERNNMAYSFIQAENNPFKITVSQCEKVYQVDGEESLLETKARTLDCENKITKMCMAQIFRILEPNAKSRATDEENVKKEVFTDICKYSILFNRLQCSQLKDNSTLKPQPGLFSKNGFFDVNSFLEKAEEANKSGNYLEFNNKYQEIIDRVINQENEDSDRTSLKGMEYNIGDFGKFAITKKLMTKLYEFKETDIYDLLNEYDMIKQTDEASNVLITSNKDARQINKNIDRVIHIAIKGYNQSFSVHVRDNSFRQYEKKFGEISSNYLSPVTTKSKVTRKLDCEPNKAVSIILKQDSGPKTLSFLEWFQDFQDHDYCREMIEEKRKAKLLERKQVEENDKIDDPEEIVKIKYIIGVQKKIEQYSGKKSKVINQLNSLRGKLTDSPKRVREENGKKVIGKNSLKENKRFAMEKVKKICKLQAEIKKLDSKILLLKSQIMEFQSEDTKEKVM